MERLLITGSSGLLGSNLVLHLSQRFQTIATYRGHRLKHDTCDNVQMDITHSDETWSVICQWKPQLVIHCAAETRVDYCEEYPEEAYRTNVLGTECLARAVASIGAKLLYISTDSVFDGKVGMYTEEAIPHPLNVYAHTKLAGEQVVMRHVADYLIVRTNIYGWNARPEFSLAEWILDCLDAGKEVPGFADIHFSPILVNDLVEVLAKMIDTDLRGIYHVGASERNTKLSFARMLCQVFDRDMALIRPAHSDEIGLKACRPKDTSLDVKKVTNILGRPMPKIIDGLWRFRQLREEGYVVRLRSSFSQEEATP